MGLRYKVMIGAIGIIFVEGVPSKIKRLDRVKPFEIDEHGNRTKVVVFINPDSFKTCDKLASVLSEENPTQRHVCFRR